MFYRLYTIKYDHTGLTYRGSSHLVDLLSKQSSSLLPKVVYYYCDYSDQRSLTADSLLGTIIYQLLDQLKPFPESLERKLTSVYNDEWGSLNNDDLPSVLLSTTEYLPRLFVIIDGLDECNKDALQQILNAIKCLATCQSSVIKLFISSRDDIRIIEPLKSYPVLQASPVNTSNDMEIYVKGAVRDRIQSGDLIVRSPELEAIIIAELTSKAHGM